jgi:aspartate oxidase
MANNLKVIIAGGGIAGLTLANALEVCSTKQLFKHILTVSIASKYRLCSP